MATIHKSRFSTVMSVLRLVVLTVIAIALVKFAFFPSKDEAQSSAIDPSFDIPQMTIKATPTTISNTLELDGNIQADPAVDLNSTAEGTVTTIFVKDGQDVDEGQDILEVRKEAIGEDTETTDDEGNVTVVPGETYYQYYRVKATKPGTIKLNALLGQSFAIGDPIGTISPGTFSAIAALSPEQLYRMVNMPEQATITIKDGPAPFACSNVEILGASPATSNDSEETPALSVTCDIPADQLVFSGLSVTLTLDAGKADQVLALPVSAVEGRSGQGFVYLPTENPDEPTKKEVTLGITDGKVIEIKEGLSESDEVLEFTPMAKDESTCDPMTGENC